MSIRTDTPPDTVTALVDAAIAARLSDSQRLGLGQTAQVTAPVARRQFRVGTSSTLKYRPHTYWDFFVLTENTVVIASVRHYRKEIVFRGLTGGAFAAHLFHAVALLADGLASTRSQLRLRILESRPINLVSVVGQSRNGKGSYAHVIDGTLLNKDEIVVQPNIAKLRLHAHDRLTMRRVKSTNILSPPMRKPENTNLWA